MSEQKSEKILVAFDFDHTLIDENSDVYIIKLAPEGKLPEEIKRLYGEDGWTEYMGEIFKFLHKNGSTRADILECMSEIPLTEGMKELLDFTNSSGCFEHIIISDSNSVFIEHILGAHELAPVVKTVFTNPAQFDENGCLTLTHHHIQDWCPLSTKNLCKGHILRDFISCQQKEGIIYSHVLYVGDGYNDLCPSLTLRQEDFIMPREGFKLHRVLEDMEQTNKPVSRSELKASVVPWQTGLDILKLVKTFGLQSLN